MFILRSCSRSCCSLLVLFPMRFEVLAEHPRDRLDKLVFALLEQAGQWASRAAIQRWIEQCRVLVDGRAVRASATVRLGACVEVDPEPPEPSLATPDTSIDIPVVYDDKHLIVIDKPAGLVVHPARGHAAGTLVNALLARTDFERAAADPLDPQGRLRPGIVHRLDKNTSGLIVVAKDPATREALKEQFARRDIERQYVAIVVGTARDAIYDTLHGRHPTNRLKFTTRVARGRRAVTE